MAAPVPVLSVTNEAIELLAKQSTTFTSYPSHGKFTETATKAEQEQCYSKIIQNSQGCKIVCIGESTHGTDEFYTFRAELTKRLLSESNFRIVLVEANWPDAFRLGQYTGPEKSFDSSPNEAAASFDEFPTWMWRNTPVFDFVSWLKNYNHKKKTSNLESKDVKFFGVDLYSLYRSQQQLLDFLDTYDQEAKFEVMERFKCFQGCNENAQTYGATAARFSPEVVQRVQDDLTKTMAELQQRAGEYMLYGASSDVVLSAIENAASIVSAEEYYRKEYTGDQVGWNTRDQHMAMTVLRLTEYFKKQDDDAPGIIIWAHNSHVGDCQATETGRRGEWNLGQMLRQTFSPEYVYNIGQGSYTGTVTAAEKWGGDCRKFNLTPAITDSYDEILHRVAVQHAEINKFRKPTDLCFIFRNPVVTPSSSSSPSPSSPTSPSPSSTPTQSPTSTPTPTPNALLMGPHLERMVGVSYIKNKERQSHYLECSLPLQFDAWFHFDTSSAVVPVDGWSEVN